MPIRRETVARKVRLDPRREAGTFRRLDDVENQTYTEFALLSLGRRKPTAGELFEANLSAEQETATFCVWHFELGFAPFKHCRIVDAQGIIWDVRLIEHRIMNTRYHCTCERLY